MTNEVHHLRTENAMLRARIVSLLRENNFKDAELARLRGLPTVIIRDPEEAANKG